MDTTTTMLIELIAPLGYRVAIAADHVEAVNEQTGERFIVRSDDVDGMAVELAGMVGVEYASSDSSDNTILETRNDCDLRLLP